MMRFDGCFNELMSVLTVICAKQARCIERVRLKADRSLLRIYQKLKLSPQCYDYYYLVAVVVHYTASRIKVGISRSWKDI